MDMIAPYYKYGYFGQDFSLILAILIGICFGFFLERGGLGNAKKLASQFYLRDFAVIKVMFTAIITAMLGLNILDAAAILDLNHVYLNPTYLIPQLTAGLLFGIGFVMGGLCPGTCLVAAATGKVDGLVTLAGILSGIFIFGELFDNFTGFLYSSSFGQINMAQLFGLPQTALVILVTITAIVIFRIIAKYEKKKNKRISVEERQKFKPDRILAYSAVIGLIVLVSSQLFAKRDTVLTDQEMSTHLQGKISAADLATQLMRKADNFVMLDLRSPQQYHVYHIPGALMDTEHISFNNKNSAIIYTQFGKIDRETITKLKEETALPVYYLEGGLSAWVDQVLYPDLTNITSMEKRTANRIKITSKFFGGYPKTGSTTESEIVKKYKREGC
jgi:rhodanese-related sulfurtransferase/uncharacterized membrane protein YedE/YeeE